MTKRKVFITLHGYKRPQWDDFHEMKKVLSKYGEVVVFDYYDSRDKNMIDREVWWKNINEVMTKYKNKEVILIGYSLGGAASLAIAGQYKNVSRVYAIVPAVKTKLLLWVFKGMIFPYYIFKSIALRIKLGNEEYKAKRRRESRGSSEPHPIKMTWEVHMFKMWIRKFFKYTKNKDIRVIYAESDGIINVRAATNFIEENITKNRLTYKKLPVEHRNVMEKGSPLYEDLEKWIKMGIHKQ